MSLRALLKFRLKTGGPERDWERLAKCLHTQASPTDGGEVTLNLKKKKIEDGRSTTSRQREASCGRKGRGSSQPPAVEEEGSRLVFAEHSGSCEGAGAMFLRKPKGRPRGWCPRLGRWGSETRGRCPRAGCGEVPSGMGRQPGLETACSSHPCGLFGTRAHTNQASLSYDDRVISFPM